MRAAVVLAALAGCGRLGFGGTGDDTPIDAPPDVSSPPSITSLTLASASATSTTFEAIPGAVLDLAAAPDTTWLLLVSATLDSTTGLEPAAEARYLVDGVERGLGGTQNVAPSLGGPWQHFAVLTGTSTPLQITFELRDVAGGTATMRDLSAIAIPLSPAVVAGMQHGAVDPVMTVTSPTPVKAASFPFTPKVPGPHLVLGLSNASDVPGEADVYVQWRDGAGALGIDAQLPRRPWQSMLSAWIVTSPVATEYSLWTHNGSGDGSLQYVRWLALPLAAFPSYSHATASTVMANMSPAPLALATAAAPPASAAATRWLYLATALVGEACQGLPLVERLVTFQAGSAPLPRIHHTTDNCASQITSGAFALLPSAPPAASISIASGNGKTVQAQEATVVVLGLP